jgi:hypothetical protein
MEVVEGRRTTQKVAIQFVTRPKLCPALTASASTNSEMIRNGIGPRPIENPATNARLAITEIRRQEKTIPRPRNRLAIPMLEILQRRRGFRPLRSMREVEGSVVARLTSDIMRDISADDEGRIAERMDVE